MQTASTRSNHEIWHPAYNPGGKDNLAEIPAEKAVFGVFAVVDEKPVNCRVVGETENLQAHVRQLFENAPGEGLKKFMQGPWIHLLQYELMPGSSAGERQAQADRWTQTHQPRVDEEGEYPGYYDY